MKNNTRNFNVPDGAGGWRIATDAEMEALVARDPIAAFFWKAGDKEHPPVQNGWIYFIQSNDNGLIKIGFTANPPRVRLSTLQTGSAARLELLVAVAGTAAGEAVYHTKFAHARRHGEWFEPTPELMAEVEQLTLFAERQPLA